MLLSAFLARILLVFLMYQDTAISASGVDAQRNITPIAPLKVAPIRHCLGKDNGLAGVWTNPTRSLLLGMSCPLCEAVKPPLPLFQIPQIAFFFLLNCIVQAFSYPYYLKDKEGCQYKGNKLCTGGQVSWLGGKWENMADLPLIEYSPLGITALALFILLFVLRNQANKPQQFNKEILEELKLMNQNHLNSIVTAINTSSHELSETIHDDNRQIIQLLGEIKGGLTK